VAARRLLSRTIYGTTTLDPVLTIAVAVLLFVVIVVAGAIPARRALRVDPVTALRNE
jgi:putative ABC transport system permease protein